MYYISKMQPQVNDGPRLSSLYFCSGWRGQEDSHYTTLTMHTARCCRPSLASSLCTNLCSLSSPAGVLAAALWQDNVMMMT